MKRCLAIVMILLICSNICTFSASAEEQPLSLNCKSAIIIEAETGKVLYEKNADQTLAPASITKVMTMLLVMEAISSGALHYEDRVTASAHAASMGGSQIWLEPGEEMSVDELIRATMIASANDAAVALAEKVSGSEEAFVLRMNEKATELGMDNTKFCNAAGLDEEGHLTTAHDIGLMCRALLQYDEIQNYSTVWMDYLRDGTTELVNTNKLVHSYDGITGLKTGTTGQAGRCLAASAKKDNFHVIAVILGCDNNDDRYGGAEKMLDWAFANFESVVPKDATLDMESVTVLHGVSQSVAVYSDIRNPVIVEKGQKDKLQYRVTVAKDVQAPVEEGQNIGSVQVVLEEEVLGTYAICCKNEVKEMDLFTGMMLFFQEILKIS